MVTNRDMLRDKNKTRTFSLRMSYDGLLYKRVEKHNFDFETDSWILDEIYWDDPGGFRIATINEIFSKPNSAHFSNELRIENEILFSNLEREYKLMSLDI